MTRKNLRRTAAIALLPSIITGLFAPAAMAQTASGHARTDTSFSVGDIVVTARGMAGSTENVLTSVDRLGAELSRRANVDYAWQLVGRLPGVLLTEFNQGTTSGKLSFRGFNGEGEINAVKLLIDGIPANSNDGNMPFIDSVFPLEIEGIEVVRGTSDPRYGLNNIAGNVSITTRQGGTYVDAKAGLGSFAKYDAQLAAGLESGPFSQNYLIGYREAEGYRDHANLDRVSVAGKWFYSFSDNVQLGAIARYYESNAEEPGYLTRAVAYSTPRVTNAYNATDGDERSVGQYSLHLNAAFSDHLDWASALYYNTFEDDRFVKFSATASQQRRVTDEKQWGGLTALHYHPAVDFAHSLMLEVGGDFQVQDNISERYLSVSRVPTSKTRDQAFDLSVYGVYAQAIIEPTDWLKITPAYRVDWVDGDFTNRANGSTAPINDYATIEQPKLSVAVTPYEGVTLYGNWGKTFQIGVGSGAYLIPPRVRDLEPSINEGWELGVNYAPDERLQARLAFWEQKASGEIKRRLNDPLGDFDNLGATKREGVDLQVNVKPVSRLSVWGAVAWQEAKITTPDPATPTLAGKSIDHIPEWLYSGGVDFDVTEKLRLSAWGNAQTTYELTTSNNRGRFGDFVKVNVEANYRLNDKVELNLQVANLTDEYSEYVWWDGAQTLHSPGESRSVYGSVRVRY